MDKRDRAILALLTENSRLSWRDIGKRVYLTGQAVGVRVQQLIDNHTIEKFTITQAYPSLQFITLYMNGTQFTEFEACVLSFPDVIEFHKVTGDGCYFIKACFTATQLDAFIHQISPYARYKVSHRLRTLK